MFNFNPDKKMSFEEMIGMANGIIGMITGGKEDLDSLGANYIPKMVEAVKTEQQKEGKPLMLNLMLSEDETHFIASVWELGTDGTANQKKSYPLNNITELTEIFKDLVSKNEENANDTLQPGTQQIATTTATIDAGAGNTEHSTGAEGPTEQSGVDTLSESGGLPGEPNNQGA